MSTILGWVAPKLCLARGNEGSGGGGGYVCNDPNHSELLDLLEAGRTLDLDAPELTIPRLKTSVDQQITHALRKLQPLRRTSVAIGDAYKKVQSASRNLVRRSGELAPPIDANSSLQKPGCTAMGFIVFNDKTGSLTWDKTNIDRLPKTDQAALWVHEGVYKYLRESKGDTDSRRARLIVAHLFSTETAEQASAAILEALGGVQPTTDVSSPFQLSGSSTQVFIGRRTDGPGGPEVRLNSDESLDWKNTFAASSHFVEEAEDGHFGQSLHINVVNELIQVNPGNGDRINLCDSRLLAVHLEEIYFVAELFCPPDLAAFKFHTSDGAVSASWSTSSFVINEGYQTTTVTLDEGTAGSLLVTLNDHLEITHVDYYPYDATTSLVNYCSKMAQRTLCESGTVTEYPATAKTAVLDSGADALIQLAKAVKGDLSQEKKDYLQAMPVTR